MASPFLGLSRFTVGYGTAASAPSPRTKPFAGWRVRGRLRFMLPRAAMEKVFSIAPMMEWTDRHCRFFHRLLTRRARLYTEMITTGAVLRGDRARLLAFDPAEQPGVVQLGGSDPKALAETARICADAGYSEINLNVGCPSDRVQEGRFGACLIAEPGLFGEAVPGLKAALILPLR